jgi:hypothetical protein
VSDSTTPPEDSFEAFARSTGLADLFELGDEAFQEDDDSVHAEDADGDSLTFIYREVTSDDGTAAGIVGLSTDGPSGVVALSVTAMEDLAEWLTAKAARARALEAEQK